MKSKLNILYLTNQQAALGWRKATFYAENFSLFFERCKISQETNTLISLF